MDKLKRVRGLVRSAFSRTYGAFNIEIEKPQPSIASVEAMLGVLNAKMADTQASDKSILDAMIDGGATDEDIGKEVEAAEEYLFRFETAKAKLRQITHPVANNVVRENSTVSTAPSMSATRDFKCPKLEITKFGGDPKEWLNFWNDFREFHVDPELSVAKKFHLLRQSMVAGSRAADVVKSYPPLEENYARAVASLESRFGRKDLLIELYVRELLAMVLNKQNNSLVAIFDKLETHLRSLGSLGVTKDMCAAMLLPLVESSLPEDLLRTWQRQDDTTTEAKTRLENLMKFLEKEVQSEERISLASSFQSMRNPTATAGKADAAAPKKEKNRAGNKISTASALVSGTAPACIFCDADHESTNCEKAKAMDYEERQQIVRKKKVCFHCLKDNHMYKNCRFKGQCAWCGKKHVILMCRGIAKGRSADGAEAPKKEDFTVSCCNTSRSIDVCLQTLRVNVKGPDGFCAVRVLIDSGSHYTYVSAAIAKKMRLPSVNTKTMVHLLFGGGKSDPRVHEQREVTLASLDGKYECILRAYDEDTICRDLPRVSTAGVVRALKSAGITLSDNSAVDEPIGLLIGADFAGRLYTGRMVQIECATAIETRLGWTLMGQLSPDAPSHADAALAVLSMYNHEASISDLWNLDTLGILDPVATVKKEERLKKIEDDFESTIIFDNAQKRYEVMFPWKDNHPALPNNRAVVHKRLTTVTEKLKRDGLFKAYGDVFKQWLALGVIEKVSENDDRQTGYYLPHRPVIKENSTTRLRPVFDASADTRDEPSLNQCLEQGPNLIELIPTVLFKFMDGQIGMVADIEKAFLQVSVTPADRESLKFLWWDDDDVYTKVVVYRHCRVVFGVRCSSFLLGGTIKHHLQRCASDADAIQLAVIEKMKNSFYVDNFVGAVNSEDEEREFRIEAIKIMRAAGFELRGWDRTHSARPDEPISVLGLFWNRRRDVLSINLEFLSEVQQPITKRKVLSVAQRVFDPLGWSCPTMLEPKLLFRQLAVEKVKWDEQISESWSRQFLQWLDQLPALSKLQLPRNIFGHGQCGSGTSFHVFTDASQYAFAACLYLRIETSAGVRLHLVQAKARVGPQGEVSIPRMELLGALLGARLWSSFIKASGRNEVSVTLWTDSSTVLSWIRRGQQWARFVANRVDEIKGLTPVEAWRHVSGKCNPADLPSRGCSPTQLIDSRWWEGPPWLKLSPEQWPEEKFQVNESLVNQEVPKSRCATSAGLSNFVVCRDKSTENTPWYLRRFSSYNKVIRMVAWLLRFVYNAKKTMQQRRKGEISAGEFQLAEILVIRMAQRECFHGVNDPRLRSLDPYLDSKSVLRTKTLISNREDLYDFKRPMLLSADHPLVGVLIAYLHVKNKHAGINTTMQLLRERVWVTSSRRAVRAVIHRCQRCRRFAAKPLVGFPASLPKARVEDAPVFQVTGVDYAGPIYLKGGSKAWICLFTCAVYRAVHIELVHSLSTESFLCAFRRFIGRRRRPVIMYSDNGTNFSKAATLLKKLDWQKIKAEGAVEKIEWIFNPPSGAWWGGWWERIIRVLKDLLKRTLGNALLDAEEMNTVLCDCESVINSRPLTCLPGDSERLLAMTPAMFLKEMPNEVVPDLDKIEKSVLGKKLRYLSRVREELRERFRSEYLGQLARRSKVRQPSIPLRVGDIVLVVNDNVKRVEWPLARVSQIVSPNVVKIKTANGELTRPLQRLVLLEADSGSRADEEPLTAAEELAKQSEGNLSKREAKEGVLNDVAGDPEAPVVRDIRTRSGRISKPPKRYSSK